MTPLTCAILEDQHPAQKVLEKYIADSDHLDLVGTYRSTAEAAHGLAAIKPDLLFLDLHLPKMNGFAFLKTLKCPPLIIVTTADAEQALDGYDHNVVDYLLKPFSFERFLQGIEKARQQRGIVASAESKPAENSIDLDLFIKCNGEIQRILIENIEFVQSQGDYVEIFTTQQKYFVPGTLSALADELPKESFVRVHKSYMVNIRHISRIVGPEIHIGGATVPIGRSYREKFLKKIGAK